VADAGLLPLVTRGWGVAAIVELVRNGPVSQAVEIEPRDGPYHLGLGGHQFGTDTLTGRVADGAVAVGPAARMQATTDTVDHPEAVALDASLLLLP